MMDWPTDCNSPQVKEAVLRSCDICHVPAGTLCRNTIQPNKPLPGRVVHFGRLVDRRRQPKEDK